MSVVTADDEGTTGIPSPTDAGHLRQALRRAQDELMAVRRARRLSDERAERLQIAIEHSDTLAALLQQQVSRARAELKEALVQKELLASESSAARQQVWRDEVEAGHRLLEQQARTEDALKRLVEVQATWSDRLLVAERETAQALLLAAESDNGLRLADARYAAEAQATDERIKAEREKAEREIAAALLRAAESDAHHAAETAKGDQRFQDELEKAERAIAEAQVRVSRSESERIVEREEFASSIADLRLALDREREERARLELLAQNLQAELDTARLDLAAGKCLAANLTEGPLGAWVRLGRRLEPQEARDARSSLALWAQATATDARRHSAYQQGIQTLPPLAYPEDRNPYHRADSLAALLSWHDFDFVRCAYVTLLGRQPDPDGEAHFCARLRKGVSKMQLIWELRRSDEGQQHDPGIAGLDRELARFRLARLPVLGSLFAPRYLGEWSPHERRFRRLENQNWLIFGSHEAAARRVDIRLDHLSSKLNEIGVLAGQWRATPVDIPVRATGNSIVPTKTVDGQSANPGAPLAVLNQFSYSSVESVRSKLRQD